MHHYLKRYLILIVSYLNFIREKNTLRNLFVFWSYWVNNRGWVTKKIIYLIRCPRGNLKCHPGWSNNPATNRLWIISEHQKKCLTSIIFCFSKRDATRAHAHTHTHTHTHSYMHTLTHTHIAAGFQTLDRGVRFCLSYKNCWRIKNAEIWIERWVDPLLRKKIDARKGRKNWKSKSCLLNQELQDLLHFLL